MDDTAATGLEAAIARLGALLVQLQKYREGAATHATLLAAALALGDRARAGHHRETLDTDAAGALGREVATVHARAAAALAAIHEGTIHRQAVAAHAAGDFASLRRLLPLLFLGLEAVPAPPDAFVALPWLRRNRPRPAAELVDEVLRCRRDGIAAEGPPDAPGAGPTLPAVALSAAPPAAEPLVLRFPGPMLPPAVYRVADSEELLVHVPRLAVPFRVVVPAALDPEELGEITVDWPPYRASLLAALRDAHEDVDAG
jgi:hypothetical protein